MAQSNEKKQFGFYALYRSYVLLLATEELV